LSADGDLDSAVRKADPERWLASRFIGDGQARADVLAIYAYDHELERAGRVTSNALLAEIRLTWWSEVLDEIFSGRPVRRHPVACALADTVRRHGHARAPLDAMIDARIEPLVDPMRWADAVGGSATLLAARTLDPNVDPAPAAMAGRVWGLLSLIRTGRPSLDIAGPLRQARQAARRVGVTAFPAIACATLARAQNPSPLEIRVRLLVAVLSGRL
jgi:phytoene synthase